MLALSRFPPIGDRYDQMTVCHSKQFLGEGTSIRDVLKNLEAEHNIESLTELVFKEISSNALNTFCNIGCFEVQRNAPRYCRPPVDIAATIGAHIKDASGIRGNLIDEAPYLAHVFGSLPALPVRARPLAQAKCAPRPRGRLENNDVIQV